MPIVEATMVSANSLFPSGRALAKAIEAGMSEAVLECSKKGITDPVEIRAAMMAAREGVKARWDAMVNEASFKVTKGGE